jgi:hypothetical protein
MDEEEPQRFILPPDEELRYDGRVAVIVGPDCVSACEFFTYDMTLEERATIIGHYPTGGLGGSVDEVLMPEDEAFRFTQGRAVDAEGNIHIEGIGVVPDVDVPLDEAAVLGEEDVLLRAAIRYLIGETIEGQPLGLGDSLSGRIEPNTRVRHTVSLSAGDVVNLIVESGDGQNVILRVLDPAGAELAESEADSVAGFAEVDFDQDVTFVLEVRAEDETAAVDYTLTIEEVES